ncbi:hypothetical protein R3P38DRAFT_2715272 [Favolaschia claudopus]|uniref:Uncharacterized protein n=1 Tax=Favolaschia claudopus TaxID=2862362 RepID=A0AAW0B0H6_9AGAR
MAWNSLANSATADKIRQIVAAAGEDQVSRYIHETFPPPLVAIGYYSAENAPNWLDIDKFMGWLSRSFQSSHPSLPSTPMHHTVPRPSQQHSQRSPLPATYPSSSPSVLPSSSPMPPTSSSAAQFRPLPSIPGRSEHRNAATLSDFEPEEPPPVPLLRSVVTTSQLKRQRSAAISISSDSNSDSETPPTTRKRSKKKSKHRREEPQAIVISKQFSVPELRTVTEPQSCWSIPRPGEDFAYLLDMREDEREWVNKKKEPLSMIAIIKAEDQDAWGQGTGGSLTKATKVAALDNVLCQVASHRCQGIYKCSQLDLPLLNNHQRYEPDDDAMRELWEAERAVNVRDTSSSHIRAASFYREVHEKKKCPFVRPDGSPCPGKPVYRKLKQMNYDGKYGFIGCQFYAPNQQHRFVSIYRDADEHLVLELFQNNGEFLSPPTAISASCARVLPPRQGGKGDQVCPYSHVDAFGKILKGKIIHHSCDATIRIFAPIDRTDRRAIVYLSGPHNHPRHPETKLTRKGKDAYKTAITLAGPNSSVLRTDHAETSVKLFDGMPPISVSGALANPRIKRKMIYDFTTVDNPYGLGWEGVVHFQQKMRDTMPPEKRYIQFLTSDDGVQFVLTMLPYLGNRIHVAKVSLHDNTYVRVHGIWKEWEVVIWDDKLDFRTTIARVYSQHESKEVFAKMWPALWDTIARVTGVEVKFKFIHGEGLRAVLLDGNKPQAQALGLDLVLRNKPHLSGVYERDPQKILKYILRTCVFHIQRKFAEMAKVVPDEEMGRIRRCLYLKDHAELNIFIEQCKKSDHKVVRDWISDKDSIKEWFWPSINEFLSEIPREDWYLTPGDTNLNESAHPYTNQHTGTNLPLLVAIQTAYKLDLQTEAKIKLMEEKCVLINHNNSKTMRSRRNSSRRESHHRKAVERMEATDELEAIDLALTQQAEATKQLKERKKEIRAVTGVKKTKKRGEKSKAALPDAEEMAGVIEPSPHSSPAQGTRLRFEELTNYTSNLEFELAPELEPQQFTLDGFEGFNPLGFDLENLPYSYLDPGLAQDFD